MLTLVWVLTLTLECIDFDPGLGVHVDSGVGIDFDDPGVGIDFDPGVGVHADSGVGIDFDPGGV